MINAYMENPILQQTALIARFFQMDPEIVLASGWRVWARRSAAFQYAAELEEERTEKRIAEAKAKANQR